MQNQIFYRNWKPVCVFVFVTALGVFFFIKRQTPHPSTPSNLNALASRVLVYLQPTRNEIAYSKYFIYKGNINRGRTYETWVSPKLNTTRQRITLPSGKIWLDRLETPTVITSFQLGDSAITFIPKTHADQKSLRYYSTAVDPAALTAYARSRPSSTQIRRTTFHGHEIFAVDIFLSVSPGAPLPYIPKQRILQPARIQTLTVYINQQKHVPLEYIYRFGDSDQTQTKLVQTQAISKAKVLQYKHIPLTNQTAGSLRIPHYQGKKYQIWQPERKNTVDLEAKSYRQLRRTCNQKLYSSQAKKYVVLCGDTLLEEANTQQLIKCRHNIPLSKTLTCRYLKAVATSDNAETQAGIVDFKL